MTDMDPVTPKQVLDAIEYAKTINKEDKYGDSAFRINISNIRPGNNGVRYASFEIKKKKGADKWEYVPLNLKFTTLNTKSKILKPDDPKRSRDGTVLKGIQIQFRKSSKYITKRKDKEGKEIVTEEKYGEAKVAIYKTFPRLVRNALKSGALNHSKKTVSTGSVQFDRKVSGGKTEPLEDPIIRVEIPFPKEKDGQSIKNDSKPKCDIYDANKRLKDGDPRIKQNGGFQFEIATLDKPDGTKVDLNYENIGEFITPGSSVSGIDSMTDIALSNLGISLPSKISLLIVKQSKGFKPVPSNVFKNEEFDVLENAEIINEEVKEEDEPNTEVAKTTVQVSNNVLDDLTSGKYDEDNKSEEEELDD